MSDPYSNLFDDNSAIPPPKPDLQEPDPNPFDITNTTEPLDDILQLISRFKPQIEQFSTFLTETRAIDHAAEAESAKSWMALFFIQDNSHAKGYLAGERTHYDLLHQKFRDIISRMKALTADHLQIVKKFNADIDKQYYSIEKTAEQVQHEVEYAADQINLQRRILSEGARDLDILEGAMKATENRLKKYIDRGGINNLSASEFAVLRQNREMLSTGSEHRFNYTYLRMNVVDKLAIRFGVYLKETTAQYLQQLMRALDHA